MSDSKVIEIPATVRVTVPIDTPDSAIDDLVSLISSDTIPTLEDVKAPIVEQVRTVTGPAITDELSHLVECADVWVDINWKEQEV